MLDRWADGVAQLQHRSPPKGFALDRWALIQSDCAGLLERHGGDMQALGWSTVDAFGAHSTASAAAVRAYGLGLLLNGCRVVELTGTSARIELRSGARQTFMRSSGGGAVPIWAVEG